MGPIASIDEIEDNSTTSLEGNGVSILAMRRGEELFLYLNECPHVRDVLDPMGGSVASPDGLLIHCQQHGAEFVADTGECVSGPCLGERLTPLAFTLSAGDIYLD